MALGRVDVDRLLAEMSSMQLSEWMAFEQLEPFGYLASIHGSAIVSSVIANTRMGKSKNSKVFEPNDFLPLERRNTGSFFEQLKDFIKRKRNQ